MDGPTMNQDQLDACRERAHILINSVIGQQRDMQEVCQDVFALCTDIEQYRGTIDSMERYSKKLVEINDGLRAKVEQESHAADHWMEEACRDYNDLIRAKAEIRRLHEIQLHGCDCTFDEACAFLRERDEALAIVKQLRAEIERLRAEIADDAMAYRIAFDCHDPDHDDRSYLTCRDRQAGIDEYRKALNKTAR